MISIQVEENLVAVEHLEVGMIQILGQIHHMILRHTNQVHMIQEVAIQEVPVEIGNKNEN
jgi:hypothetical protein